MPTLLVQVCRHIPKVGLLCTLDQIQKVCVLHRDGPFRGPGHHNLHHTEHNVHGHGTLSNDSRV